MKTGFHENLLTPSNISCQDGMSFHFLLFLCCNETGTVTIFTAGVVLSLPDTRYLVLVKNYPPAEISGDPLIYEQGHSVN